MEMGKRVPWWHRWFSKAAFLAILSSVANTFGNIASKHVLQNIITGSDELSAALVFLLIGSWVWILIGAVNDATLGRWIEPDYPGITSGSRKTQLLAMVSGLLGAVATGGFLLRATQILDPSVVIALVGLHLLFLAVYDSVRGNISLERVWLFLLAILSGSFLTSLNKIELSLQAIQWFGVFLLIVWGVLVAIGSIADQEGSRSSDGVTYSFWRRLWFSLWATTLSIGLSVARGHWTDFTNILANCLWRALPWVSLVLFFSYFGATLKTTASRYGAVSIVSMLLNFKVILGIPLTLIVAGVFPGMLGEIPTDARVWVVRVAGVLLLFWGINALRKIDREEEE